METQSLRIEIGSIIDNWDQMEPLFEPHWDEVAKNKEVMVLKPNKEQYATLEKGGMLLSLFAYYGDKLVGYSINIVTTHLHYSDLRCAYNDVLFLHPAVRNSPLGIKLIRLTEKAAKDVGVKFLVWHAKQNTTLDKILPRMKYNVQEIMYSKVL